MLIRHRTDGSFECITQEHHALISGLLATEWAPTRLDPLLIQTIGLHDNPWREADTAPAYDPETGLPYDFLSYPTPRKLVMYDTGLSALEALHPWTAYIVSRHYTTFAGTRDIDEFTAQEQTRRERLAEQISETRLADSDDALAWVKFFDVASLYLCLGGPKASDDSVPAWLEDPSTWNEAPDGTEVEWNWYDDGSVGLRPWPFARAELTVDIHHRRLDGPVDNPEALGSTWTDASRGVRQVTFKPLHELTRPSGRG
jgi:hypothetical protein